MGIAFRHVVCDSEEDTREVRFVKPILVLLTLINCAFFTPLWAQDTLRFGPVRMGTVAYDTLLISNINPVELMISDVTLKEDAFQLPPAPFSGEAATIPSGGNRELSISFWPDRPGVFEDELVLATSAGHLQWVLLGKGGEEVIVINEILADPPGGLAGDANRDGVRSSSADEFVELLNTGLRPIEIGGWQLSDRGTASNKRFAFPAHTWLDAGERAVLFGGGAPAGFHQKVFVDDGKIGGGLSNLGDAVFLINPATTDTIAQAEWGKKGGKDQSLVRYPDGDGLFVLHTEFPGKGDRFSPGDEQNVLQALYITPGDTAIALGEEVRFSVLGAFLDGSRASIDDYVTWMFSDSVKIAQISADVWKAEAPGTIQITAEAGGIGSSPIELEVLPPDVVAVEIVPGDTTILVDESLALIIKGRLSDGTVLWLDDDLQWEAKPSDRVSFDGNSAVGKTPGSVAISASYQNLRDSISAQVVGVGDLNQDMTIDLLDAVRLVHLILGIEIAVADLEIRSADLDGNGILDIRDLIGIIALFTGGDVSAAKVLAPDRIGAWWWENGALIVEPGASVHIVSGELLGKDLVVGFPSASLKVMAGSVDGLKFILGSTEQTPLCDPMGVIRLEVDSCEVKSLDAYTLSGTRTVLQERMTTEIQSQILSGFPNPFNPETVIKYEIANRERITLKIYSLLGQEIVELIDDVVEPGQYRAIWDGRDAQNNRVGSGVYLATLRGSKFRSIHKLVLLR